MKKLSGLSAALLLLMVLLFGCSDNLEVVPDVKLKSYQSGTHDGYFWSLWTDDQSGWVDYQNGSGGNYSVSWDYAGNFTCGKGWSSGSTTRVVGYNCGVYTHNGGGGVFGYYGWTRNPLREYYVNEMWGTGRPTGTNMGTINSDGGTYNIYRSQRVNAPSIDGTQTFWQIYSTRTSENSTGQNHTITFANHANAWAGTGYGLGSDLSPAAILLTEAYSGSSGYVNATVWEAGNSSGGGGSGGGSSYPVGTELPMRLRARSTDGQGQVRLFVGGNAVATWTLGTNMADYNVSLWTSRGDIRLEFINDSGGRDIQVDYLSVGGTLRQAENQSYNTAVYQNGSCGGSNSEWMHCGGAIGFGNTP